MRLSITTERLTLRPPEDADASALARGLTDIEVARMTCSAPHPYPVEVAEGWIFIERVARLRGLRFTFVVDVPGEGVSGVMGVFKRARNPDWEVGYWIAPHAWGRGYATEALAGLLRWARDDLGAERVLAGHFDDNPASRRVLEKAGFTNTGELFEDFSLARRGSVRGIGMACTLVETADAA